MSAMFCTMDFLFEWRTTPRLRLWLHHAVNSLVDNCWCKLRTLTLTLTLTFYSLLHIKYMHGCWNFTCFLNGVSNIGIVFNTHSLILVLFFFLTEYEEKSPFVIATASTSYVTRGNFLFKWMSWRPLYWDFHIGYLTTTMILLDPLLSRITVTISPDPWSSFYIFIHYINKASD